MTFLHARRSIQRLFQPSCVGSLKIAWQNESEMFTSLMPQCRSLTCKSSYPSLMVISTSFRATCASQHQAVALRGIHKFFFAMCIYVYCLCSIVESLSMAKQPCEWACKKVPNHKRCLCVRINKKRPAITTTKISVNASIQQITNQNINANKTRVCDINAPCPCWFKIRHNKQYCSGNRQPWTTYVLATWPENVTTAPCPTATVQNKRTKR